MARIHKNSDNSIKFGLVLNTLFTFVEFGFGFVTGSLALIADATQNLTDSLTLTISYLASRLARRKADGNRTFGYGRATILAAMLNSSIMLAVAGIVGFEAIHRLDSPREIEGGVVVAVAIVGIAVNGSIAYVLSKHRRDLNMRSAFINMAFDTLSSVAAVISGLIIMVTGVSGIDSAVGLLIAVLLLVNAFIILKEAVHILLEGTPRGLDIAAITKTIKATDKVERVTDVHLWSIRSGYNALSCRIVINEAEMSCSHEVIEAVKANLHANYDIAHATIEVDLEGCAKDEEYEKH